MFRRGFVTFKVKSVPLAPVVTRMPLMGIIVTVRVARGTSVSDRRTRES